MAECSRRSFLTRFQVKTCFRFERTPSFPSGKAEFARLTAGGKKDEYKDLSFTKKVACSVASFLVAALASSVNAVSSHSHFKFVHTLEKRRERE